MRSTLDEPFAPLPLLPTTQVSDFSRNFRQLEKAAKRPYSLAKVIRELAKQPPALSGFERECHEELSALDRTQHVLGRFVPMEALSRRDLSVTGLPQIVQTSVGEDVIPFLRFKAVTGRLGATVLTDLTGGPWRLPRATGTGGASWQNETAATTNSEATFDAVTLTPSRVSSNSILSKQLVIQSQPAIEEFLIDELGAAIATEVDRVVLNGSGVAPQPQGILALPVNPAGTYAYNARSPNVVFGGGPRVGRACCNSRTRSTDTRKSITPTEATVGLLRRTSALNGCKCQSSRATRNFCGRNRTRRSTVASPGEKLSPARNCPQVA
jgi:hypothetical protein